MKKQAMTESVLAAIAAGIPVEAATSAEGPSAEADHVSEPQAEGAAAAAAPVEPVPAAPAAADASLVTYLQGEVKAKTEALLEAQIEVRDMKAQVAGMEATHHGLSEIVGRSLNQMRIALGGSATDLAKMDAATLLAEHARVSVDFLANFKAGGVAAVDATEPKKNEPAVQDALTQARLAAVRFSK